VADSNITYQDLWDFGKSGAQAPTDDSWTSSEAAWQQLLDATHGHAEAMQQAQPSEDDWLGVAYAESKGLTSAGYDNMNVTKGDLDGIKTILTNAHKAFIGHHNDLVTAVNGAPKTLVVDANGCVQFSGYDIVSIGPKGYTPKPLVVTSGAPPNTSKMAAYNNLITTMHGTGDADGTQVDKAYNALQGKINSIVKAAQTDDGTFAGQLAKYIPSPKPSKPTTSTQAPEQVSHPVAAGESLWKIAEIYYGPGHGDEWTKIYAANKNNPDVRNGGQTIYVGAHLVVPKPTQGYPGYKAPGK
jgi:LysM repeat protein